MLWFGVGCAFIFAFYNVLSLLLQHIFYVCAARTSKAWRIQSAGQAWSSVTLPPVVNLLMHELSRWKASIGDPSSGQRAGEDSGGGSAKGIEQRQRAHDHDLISTINLCTASVAAGAVFELTARGHSGIVFSLEAAGGLGSAAACTVAAVGWQLVLEYYWHRMMHLPFFYRRFHKMHHRYKSPQPFDDMYIHPLEAIGYYLILYSPAFIFRLHWVGFAVYMSIMGSCGILDHCGIQVEALGLYNTADHDKHHQLFDCNFAFPFVYMDILHGTFAGTFCSRQYSLESLRLRKLKAT